MAGDPSIYVMPEPLELLGYTEPVKDALRELVAAEEAELHRMLLLWPTDRGKPAVARDRAGVMLGLCVADAPIGEVAEVLVPARRIEMGFEQLLAARPLDLR